MSYFWQDRREENPIDPCVLLVHKDTGAVVLKLRMRGDGYTEHEVFVEPVFYLSAAPPPVYRHYLTIEQARDAIDKFVTWTIENSYPLA